MSRPASRAVVDDNHVDNRTSAEEAGRTLPGDPIKAQEVVCAAVVQLAQNGEPDASQLGALLVLDQHARAATEALLVRYVEGDEELRALDRKYWQAALRLSQAFCRGYERFLGNLWKAAAGRGSTAASSVLIQLFHHRQVEFLLRLLRYKKRNSGQWRELHETYALALARNLTRRAVAINRADSALETTTTLEQEYLRILLLELMNNGAFSPQETLWAYRWFARWCSAVMLQACDPDDGAGVLRQGFVVDLNGIEGLTRGPHEGKGPFFRLDTAPLLAKIAEEIGSVRDSGTVPGRSAPAERTRQVALLAKLEDLLAPNPVRVEVRDAREPVALSVEAIAGLPVIVQVLREEALKQAREAPAAANLDTISPLGEPTRPSTMVTGSADRALFSSADAFSGVRQTWQVKDRSDTGCRMRAQIDDLNRTIPGSLIAIRDIRKAPWTVAVVRRFRRLMVDHVEIDVEHIGRRPRFVKIVTGEHADPYDDSPDQLRRCFAAVYLPRSEEHPAMSIRSLLLPAREFRSGCRVTLLSSSATYRLQINTPIEQELEFVWTSFTIIERLAARSADKAR